ncbi:plasmid replication initiator [Oceaniovalibus guishaninsula JLT2003]|uniref:Plasmid replication initiator n=1 Tax=Oceaniovalibus guishaninsula JLT2003 TaxID=1231392 RepID=K2HJW7_9RHOB|nr:replication initiator protein A [Oceaniovalibus guishaninsula]EKE43294.1 plasmid replication initiator [Oceaniovalibus guishaninsula JLT2003]
MSEHLKPIKHPQGDLFVCDITDVILKDDLASMEHPFYSLSKKPDRDPRRYEWKGQWIEFRPSIKGMPTIYDKDLIIYAISQLIAGMKEGRAISKRVLIDPYAFLVFTQRGVGGRDYDALCDSLDRIDGTRFRTNILFEGTRTDEWMGLIDGAKMKTDDRTGKVKSLELKLSDMVVSSVEEMNVLTLHRDYFRLSRPIERRIYEIARKAVGQDESWAFLMTTLHHKSGSKGTLREFRRQMKPIIEGDYLPDYMIVYDETADLVTFINRNTMPRNRDKAEADARAILQRLSPDSFDAARDAAPGWDVHHLADTFAAWWGRIGKPVPRNPDALFLKFCTTWQSRNGNPS